MTQNLSTGSNSKGAIALTPKDLKTIAGLLITSHEALTRIDEERGNINEAIKDVAEETGASPKLLRRLIRAKHKRSYDADVQENREFESTYVDVESVAPSHD